MHRSQVMFKEQQYLTLKRIAAARKKSIAQVLREMVDTYSEKTGAFSLSSIEGIAEDTVVYGKDHDEVLYRAK
jgi:hypothetical protein